VAKSARLNPEQRESLLEGELEGLALKAKELSLTLDEVIKALRKHWKEL
jgi:hypothetical protein